ncbi:hypothetical protein [Nocardioides zhouii]|uniref:Peptidase MA-like domain-containing protein n=1 Tax=Nocardioides zhouii TaxID=1168729 RepID=A0A4Q2SIU3_9ACTN|nr:hypothetical protein [Nocardioides zhouii]RYC05302.1 hypothetical protein EUA94_19705 [Nocardioides zhouii]
MVAIVAVVLVTRGGRHEVEPGVVDVQRASPAAAAQVLRDFVAAVDAEDADALAALAPVGDDAAADLLTGIGSDLPELDLRQVSARYVDQVGTVAEDGSWTALTELTWQFGSFDAEPSQGEVLVSFAPSGDGLGITGFGAGATSARGRVPLWLHGDLSVSGAPGVLVLVDGSRADAAEVVARVERGIAVVRRVLPAWRAPVVVEVPASAADLDETLGVAPGTYAGIAAVTATAGSGTDDEAPVHVFVNPEVTAGLRRAGAQVVMSHELVHVATDAARSGTEPWLVEGFADYVALRDTGLPDRTTLGRAIAAVRRDGAPDGLPTAADLGTQAPDLQARYEEAWLACRIIAERLGERGFVAVYDAAGSGTPVTSALGRRGLPVSELVRLWRARLELVAR